MNLRFRLPLPNRPHILLLVAAVVVIIATTLICILCIKSEPNVNAPVVTAAEGKHDSIPDAVVTTVDNDAADVADPHLVEPNHQEPIAVPPPPPSGRTGPDSIETDVNPPSRSDEEQDDPTPATETDSEGVDDSTSPTESDSVRDDQTPSLPSIQHDPTPPPSKSAAPAAPTLTDPTGPEPFAATDHEDDGSYGSVNPSSSTEGMERQTGDFQEGETESDEKDGPGDSDCTEGSQQAESPQIHPTQTNPVLAILPTPAIVDVVSNHNDTATETSDDEPAQTDSPCCVKSDDANQDQSTCTDDADPASDVAQINGFTARSTEEVVQHDQQSIGSAESTEQDEPENEPDSDVADPDSDVARIGGCTAHGTDVVVQHDQQSAGSAGSTEQDILDEPENEPNSDASVPVTLPVEECVDSSILPASIPTAFAERVAQIELALAVLQRKMARMIATTERAAERLRVQLAVLQIHLQHLIHRIRSGAGRILTETLPWLKRVVVEYVQAVIDQTLRGLRYTRSAVIRFVTETLPWTGSVIIWGFRVALLYLRSGLENGAAYLTETLTLLLERTCRSAALAYGSVKWALFTTLFFIHTVLVSGFQYVTETLPMLWESSCRSVMRSFRSMIDLTTYGYAIMKRSLSSTLCYIWTVVSAPIRYLIQINYRLVFSDVLDVAHHIVTSVFITGTFLLLFAKMHVCAAADLLRAWAPLVVHALGRLLSNGLYVTRAALLHLRDAVLAAPAAFYGLVCALAHLLQESAADVARTLTYVVIPALVDAVVAGCCQLRSDFVDAVRLVIWACTSVPYALTQLWLASLAALRTVTEAGRALPVVLARLGHSVWTMIVTFATHLAGSVIGVWRRLDEIGAVRWVGCVMKRIAQSLTTVYCYILAAVRSIPYVLSALAAYVVLGIGASYRVILRILHAVPVVLARIESLIQKLCAGIVQGLGQILLLIWLVLCAVADAVPRAIRAAPRAFRQLSDAIGTFYNLMVIVMVNLANVIRIAFSMLGDAIRFVLPGLYNPTVAALEALWFAICRIAVTFIGIVLIMVELARDGFRDIERLTSTMLRYTQLLICRFPGLLSTAVVFVGTQASIGVRRSLIAAAPTARAAGRCVTNVFMLVIAFIYLICQLSLSRVIRRMAAIRSRFTPAVAAPIPE